MDPSIVARPLTRQIRHGLANRYNGRAALRCAIAGPQTSGRSVEGRFIGARTLATDSGPEEKRDLPSARPHIRLYTGTDCSLCDVVKDTLHQAQKEHPFHIDFYNIRDDSLPNVQTWRRAYQYDIPVVHLNGKEIARHRLDKDALIAKLREAA